MVVCRNIVLARWVIVSNLNLYPAAGLLFPPIALLLPSSLLPLRRRYLALDIERYAVGARYAETSSIASDLHINE
jgi:hypothetical protein